MKVVVGASSFSESSNTAMDTLLKYNIEVIKNPFGRRMTESEIIEHLNGADGLLAGLEPLKESVFSACPRLKAIARIGIGIENIDLDAARRYGIKVSNTPDEPTEAVAEMTLTALLSIIHQLIPSNDDVHRGVWKKRIGNSIRGLKVFIIGYGRIGRRTAELMEELGAEIIIYDKFDANVSTCTLEDGLKCADVISLHASGKDLVLGEHELSLCKKGIIILNSARGELIDEKVLCHMLDIGHIDWFWGDALWQEPYKGILISNKRAILTPHISTYTRFCRENMETAAVKNLLEDLNVYK